VDPRTTGKGIQRRGPKDHRQGNRTKGRRKTTRAPDQRKAMHTYPDPAIKERPCTHTQTPSQKPQKRGRGCFLLVLLFPTRELPPTTPDPAIKERYHITYLSDQDSRVLKDPPPFSACSPSVFFFFTPPQKKKKSMCVWCPRGPSDGAFLDFIPIILSVCFKYACLGSWVRFPMPYTHTHISGPAAFFISHR
jgi:hypothetical protein